MISRRKFHQKMPAKAIGVALFAASQIVPAAWAKDCLVYFGTFTNEMSKGIYVSRLDLDTGRLSAPELAAATPSPNYLAVSPDGKFLYAATRVDTFENQPGGAVSVFSVDGRTGKLKLLDEKYSGGLGPCYVGVDASGRTVFAANYPGGSVKSFHVNSDGTLAEGGFIQHHGHSVNPVRQNVPHAHCFVAAPGGTFALACDLGLDKVMIYRFDAATGALSTNEQPFVTFPPGSGPRHLAFSPDGKTVYVVSEIACTVTVFAWDGVNGKLDQRQIISLLPPGVAPSTAFTAAEIAVRPDGRFVYATVRGLDSISVLAVDPRNGLLTQVDGVPCGGKVPRGMGIDPTGRWLIVGNQDSQTVTAFGINAGTGRLTSTGQTLSVGAPVDVKFAPMQ